MTEQVRREPLLEIEKVLPILDKISIFGGFNESQLFKVFQRLKQVHYPSGEIIFEEGGAASYIYVVQSGQVDLVFDVHGESHLKAQLEPGTCFGETSLIGIQPHSATAVARLKTDLLVLSSDTLDDLFQEDKELFALLVLNIARESCRRLFKTNKRLRDCLDGTKDVLNEGIWAY